MASQSPPDRTGGAALARRYRALFENMSEGFVVCEAVLDEAGRLVDYKVLAANPVFVRRAPGGDRLVGRRQREVRPETSTRWFEACAQALAGQPVRFEFLDPLNGRWYEVHMSRISEVEFGQFFVDVTERKTAESRQAELFSELNHRVKNNLAVISSILELQARGNKEEVRAELGKAVDRIRALGDLHTLLYQQGSSELVDLCGYLGSLGSRLAAGLFAEGRLRLETRCSPVHTTVQRAVSLGLIVNELVTNAAKHAFPDGAAGVISVDLTREPEGLKLRVADNGRGLGQAPIAERLGFRILRSLAAGLDGELVIRSTPSGCVVDVLVPADDAPP